MFALLGVALTLGMSLWRLRRDSLRFAVVATTLANFAGLVFVAMITQQSYYIWALVGASAAVAAGAPRARAAGWGARPVPGPRRDVGTPVAATADSPTDTRSGW